MSACIDLEIKPLARRLEDAAKMMGLSRPHIYKLAKAGQVNVVRIGGRIVMLDTEIERILKEGIPKNDHK